VDMRVLLEWRYRVLGVELSDIAARDFFEENGLRYQRRKEGAFEIFDGDDATILCGDVFDLGAQQLSQVDAVYDRAALIALDEPARDRYVRQLSALLPDGVPQLVVTLEYDEQRMDGPPFSVSPSEVQARYSHRYGVRSLGHSDVLDDEPRFRERGLDSLTEHAFLLIDAKA